MKKLLLALMLVSTTVLAAGDRIDAMDRAGVTGYCSNEKGLVVDGARARNKDVARAVKPTTEEQRSAMLLAYRGGPAFEFPTDAIYYNALDENNDGLNEREVAFFTEWILKGWDMADYLIKDFLKHNPEGTSVFLTSGAIDTIARTHEQACLARRSAGGLKQEVNYRT